MGIFNFFIVIPQIFNGIFGGPIVKNLFGNMSIDYIVVGGFCLVIAAAVTMFLIKGEGKESDKELEEEIQQVHF